MQREETKDNGNKGESADFECCNPINFQKMFKKMSKCCPGQDDATDFSAMMKNMMEMCCGHKTTDTKGDADFQKEQEGDTESTEKEGCCS